MVDAGDTLIGGRYQTSARLGAGAAGRVYRADDQRTGQQVTLKLYYQSTATQIEEIILRRLDHPHIIRLLDAGFDAAQQVSYLVFSAIDGQTLAERLATMGQLPLVEVADSVGQLASALDYLHAQGVIHRDVKPANVLRDGRGQLCLFDFGSASVEGMQALPQDAERLAELLERRDSITTAAGVIVGTPEYFAPEQMRGGAIGPATDIYALGMTAYELLTGQLPFTGETMWQVLAQVAEREAPPASQLRNDLPAPASAVVARALSKVPAQRYPTAQAFAQALALGLRGEAVPGAALDTSGPPAPPSADPLTTHLPLEVFISYSRRDAALIDRLDHDLQDNGYRTWIDRSALVGGREWRRDLLTSIQRAPLTLVALSPESVASPYCAMEYQRALKLKRGVLPILLAPCAIPPALAHIQVIDCSQDYAAGLRDLLRALRVYAQAMAMATTAAPRPHGLRGLLSRLRR